MVLEHITYAGREAGNVVEACGRRECRHGHGRLSGLRADWSHCNYRAPTASGRNCMRAL